MRKILSDTYLFQSCPGPYPEERARLAGSEELGLVEDVHARQASAEHRQTGGRGEAGRRGAQEDQRGDGETHRYTINPHAEIFCELDTKHGATDKSVDTTAVPVFLAKSKQLW